ncbi:MAG: Pycsar system effector family protein [Chitinophagaceae bacterium]
MNVNPVQVFALAAENVREQFKTTGKPSLFFHNYHHTESVVRACTEMANHYRLPEEEKFVLLVAAWFHDTGYLQSGAPDHEEASVEISRKFLTDKEIPEEIADKIFACIRVTRMPQSPASLVEKIICDADLSHLGMDTFPESNKALKNELIAAGQDIYDKQEWAFKSIRFLDTHRYFTDYALQKFEPGKQSNLKKLKKKYPEEAVVVRQAIAKKETAPEGQKQPFERDEKKPKKPAEDRPDRGVETMFRTTSSNHLKLSEMADSKAHIMISVNSIILSVTISVLLTKLDRYPNFIIPTAILLIVCVTAIIFAVLTTRPNVTSGKFVKEDIQDKKPNLLFFGNFHEMSLDDYSWGMKELMNNREYLYGSMIKDIYYLGVVLAKKYRFLRISYNVFMYGLIASVIAYGIASFFSASI